MTFFPKIRQTLAFQILSASEDVYRYSFLIPKYQGLDESLISSFELSDDSSGGYFRNFIRGVFGPSLEDTPYSYKAQARKHTFSYNLA